MNSSPSEKVPRHQGPSNSAQPANQSPSSLCDVHRHDEGHKFLNPRIDGAALLDRLHYGGEVVIRQDPRPTRARAQSNCYYEALYSHLFTIVHQHFFNTPPHRNGPSLRLQAHLCSAFRHFGALQPHGHANTRLVQRRRVVHAVARPRGGAVGC